MNRRTIGTLCGLGLVVACTGGGSPNDFGLGPSDNAPTDPGAPADPNAPPGNPNDPPFSDGTSSPDDCGSVCRELIRLCVGENSDYNECVQSCTTELPPACRPQAFAYVRCVARNGCMIDEPDDLEEGPNGDPGPEVCERELVAYANCLGPDVDPPDDGEGGAGNI